MSKKSSPQFPRCLKFLKNKAPNTWRTYFQAISKYEEFHGTSMEDLVREALDEQTRGVPHHLLKVIERIEDFQDYLIEENYVYGTITIHVGRIKSIYNKNRVYLPYIESIDPKQCRVRETIEYKDVLTKDELKLVLPHMRLPLRARAMAMIQGGFSNEECEHLTTRAFIDETRKYHQCDDDVKALEWLSDENHPIIWVTKLMRIKTGRIYYGIIGAEAVNMIASAKLYEMDLPKNKGHIPDKLFDTHKGSLGRMCIKLNQRFNLGKVAEENKLKPHNLRRFHATYIRGGVLNYEENTIISNAEIDEMQGRGKTSVQDTYIKTNPLQQKLIYAKVMNNLSLYHEYDYDIVDSDVRIWIVDPTDENKKLKREVELLEKKLQKKREASEKVQELRKTLGDDVFKELLGEILNAK